MIDIESAISQSKNMENVSAGGSPCFDFGDTVLVRYSCANKYLKNGIRIREKSEEIMDAINKKAKDGVNTPMHLAIKRTIEGEEDICYVLQAKCPGYNCKNYVKDNVSFEEMCDSLKFVLNIPFEHYQKLIVDGCKLFEMGHEAQNKNLFYDSESGFWFIDFLSNDKENAFNPNDIKNIFEAIVYRLPNPIRMASCMKYGVELTTEQSQKENNLKYAINAKTLLAIKSVLPQIEKYEKFLLFEETDDYKRYLLKEGVVNKDLTIIEPIDYQLFHELYEIVIKGLIDKIVNKGEQFWSIECNDIGNDSKLFRLQVFFEKSKYNTIIKEEFDNKYDYEYEVRQSFKNNILNDLISRLKLMKQNENIIKFLSDADAKLNLSEKKY